MYGKVPTDCPSSIRLNEYFPQASYKSVTCKEALSPQRVSINMSSLDQMSFSHATKRNVTIQFEPPSETCWNTC